MRFQDSKSLSRTLTAIRKRIDNETGRVIGISQAIHDEKERELIARLFYKLDGALKILNQLDAEKVQVEMDALKSAKIEF